MHVSSHSRNRLAFALPTLLLASSMLTATSALAQGATVGEIVVTAQKREENLQKVPISVQAIGEERLEQLQVTDVNDYVKLLPSVSVQALGPGFNRIYMRGVASGENRNHSGPQPSVGVYLDEHPITTIVGELDVHVYDVARVEALSGPQGTLYGATSQAGTIRIITNKPQLGLFSAGYDLDLNTVEHGSTGYGAEGFVNVPLGERAAIRLVGWAQHDAGYIDNEPGTRHYPTAGITIANPPFAEDNFNDVDTYGGRAALKIDLNESWTVTPSIMGQDQKSNGVFSYDPLLGELNVHKFRPDRAHDRWYQAALTVEGQISDFSLVYAGAYTQRRVDTESDYSDYSYWYDALYYYTLYDNNGVTIDPTQYINGLDRYKRQSHELRLSSPADRRLRAVAGLFYQRQQHRIHQQYLVDNLSDSIEVSGHPDTIWLTEQKRVDREYAAFGELSFDITEQLTATGGVRVFKSHNTLVGFFGYGAGFSSGTGEAVCFGPSVVPGSPCTNLDKGIKESDWLHRLNLTYEIDDQKMVYATWSKGYRPGGINRRGTLPPYTADFLTNYEVGWKTTWANGTVRFNGAAFWEEWKDFQFSILGANGLTEIKNANQARVRGVEGDLTWRPTEGLTIGAAATYIVAKLTANFCGFVNAAGEPETNCPAPQAPKGQRLPVTPKFKANGTIRYEWPMDAFTAHVQAVGSYQSSVWADLLTADRGSTGKQESYGSVDLSAGVARDNWTFTIYLQNAFDELGDVTRFTQCTICGPQIYITPIQPRTLGVRWGQKF